MKIQFERIASQLQVNASDLLIKAMEVNIKHQLDIEDFNDVTEMQYNIIRSLLDENFMVRLMGKGISDRKYNYHHAAGFVDLEDWLSEQGDLTDFGTRYLQSILPDCIESRGQQVLSAAMRNLGYSIRRIEVDGKIARRWYKPAPEISFL